MNTSDQTYKAYSFADHKEVYLLLEKVFTQFDIFYYLIGANARDVSLYKAGIKPSRGTADIDFAVMVPDMINYIDLKSQLKAQGFIEPNQDQPYRLFYSRTNTVIDLLPFGEIEEKNTVSFSDRQIEISTVGFKQMVSEVEPFEHPEGFSIPVLPAHGIVLLKLISWGEKPEWGKDLLDIKELLESAWELYEPELYQENAKHADVFGTDNFKMPLVAARIMGRKMKSVLNQDQKLKTLILKQLGDELSHDVGPMVANMAAASRNTVMEIKEIFSALVQGIND
ncbi:MAG: hypothetical protein KDC83_04295 [Flavobacteriales bacterium]|nr:hypothetical protein [Flavobacteriales bacterium]